MANRLAKRNHHQVWAAKSYYLPPKAWGRFQIDRQENNFTRHCWQSETPNNKRQRDLFMFNRRLQENSNDFTNTDISEGFSKVHLQKSDHQFRSGGPSGL